MKSGKLLRRRAAQGLGLVLAVCLFAPAIAHQALAEDPPQPTADDVTTIFKSTYATKCTTLMDEPQEVTPTKHTLHFRYAAEGNDGEQRTLTLYEYECFRGAYNFGSVFFSRDDYGEISPVSFAFPALEVTYVDPQDPESAVKALKLNGFYADTQVMLADVDEEAGTIHHFSKWRGLADAAESGMWRLENGHFVLKEFSVDASFDGEINPQTVYQARQ